MEKELEEKIDKIRNKKPSKFTPVSTKPTSSKEPIGSDKLSSTDWNQYQTERSKAKKKRSEAASVRE